MVALLFLLTISADSVDTIKIAKLFKTASEWRVGEAVHEVDSARNQLVAIGKPSLEYIFSNKLKTTSTLEYRAIKNIVKRLNLTARPFLERCLNSRNDTVLTNCLRLIGDIRDSTFSERIVSFLDHKNNAVRRSALVALGRLKYKKALPSIIKCLKDSSFRMRLTAVTSASYIGGRDVVSPLMDVFLNDEFFTVRMAAARAIAKSDPAYGIELTLSMMDSIQNSRLKASLIELLDVLLANQIHDELLMLRTKRVLVEALDDPSPEVRGYAVRALFHVHDQDIIIPLRALHSREDNLFVIAQLEEALKFEDTVGCSHR